MIEKNKRLKERFVSSSKNNDEEESYTSIFTILYSICIFFFSLTCRWEARSQNVRKEEEMKKKITYIVFFHWLTLYFLIYGINLQTGDVYVCMHVCMYVLKICYTIRRTHN